ncbi:hypothetical protein BDB01DRAFT_732089 [Pilobolus umbonatus]|nr:hypothetical protein BDB01DRAFT_732089 [Pilobolus umbonatus]
MWLEEKSTNNSRSPVFHMCCGKGKYICERHSSTLTEMAELLIGNDARSTEFKSNIRAYNSALSFTSIGVNLDHSVANNQVGAYNFRIHGGVYHRIGTLLPSPGSTPCFAQIYMYDGAEEIIHRHSHAPRTNISTLNSLQALMHSINPFVAQFKNMARLSNEGIIQ